MNVSIAMNATHLVGPPTWHPMQICELAACLIGSVSNLVIAVVLLLDKHLHTPFTVYLLLLLTSNLLQASVFYPLDIISHLYSHAWWLGERACDLFNYFIFVFGGVLMQSHALITFNRLWAITFPLSYRNYHSTRVALLLCGGCVAYVHLVCLPGVVIDALYYRPPVDRFKLCSLDIGRQFPWAVASEVIIYIAPIVFVVGAYPFLFHKQHQRKGAVHGSKQDSVMDSKVTGAHPARKEHSHGFVVLTLSSVGIMVSFAPGQIVALLMLAGVGGDLRQASLVTAILALIQPALDPIFFVLCLKDLRLAIVRIARSCVDRVLMR
ncbi:olfactory receptor 1-like [Paramacrobiotus metropolitanus]|uniref:olfactory receptor 1-like n=1 Tax=Paramacrobiotus metropolitanus TaxID=2943436 RepID=UPI002445DA12|nr:olfactory receptor 1-like [Paramacrobiotus metropolitanus]